MAAKKKAARRKAAPKKRTKPSRPSVGAVEFDHLFLGTANFAASWEFWTNKLGLKGVSKWGSPEYAGSIQLGDGGITVAQGEEGPYDELGYEVVNGRPQLYLRTKNVDALHRELTNKGAKILRAPLTTHFGARCFSVEGPDGLVVVITQAK